MEIASLTPTMEELERTLRWAVRHTDPAPAAETPEWKANSLPLQPGRKSCPGGAYQWKGHTTPESTTTFGKAELST